MNMAALEGHGFAVPPKKRCAMHTFPVPALDFMVPLSYLQHALAAGRAEC